MIFAHHVFLSYSRKDTDMMNRVRDELRASGLTVWTDEGLEAGTPSWTRDIDQAIRNTGCLVVLLSPDAYNSEWVGREIAFAQTHNKRIFPMLVRGDTTNAVPFDLARHNFVDIRTNYDTGMQKTIRDIRKHLNIPAPQPKPVYVPPPQPQPVYQPPPQAKPTPIPVYESPKPTPVPVYEPPPIAIPFKQLQVLNPLDWAKLLWWILLDPKQWVQYRQAQGKNEFTDLSDEPVRAWLTSTLTWLPLFWLTFGIAINSLPIIQRDYEWARYAVFIIIMVWIFTGIIIQGDDYSGLAGGVAVIVMGGVLVILALIVTGGVAVVLAVVLAVVVTRSVLGGVKGRYDNRIGSVVEEAIRIESATWATILIFVTLIAVHAFLIWYSLLGGYHVLN
ncbi:MAG: TIR domain-containing protein [bacterium]|nr:TIR domain-containing protein [bacterium]